MGTKKNMGSIVLIVVLSCLVVGLVVYIICDKVMGNEDGNNNPGNNSGNNTANVDQIDTVLLETEIKKAIVTIAKSEELYSDANSVFAEGHKTLKSEMKDGKIYAYVLATYGAYNKTNGTWKSTSGAAGPLVLIFTKMSNSTYTYSSNKQLGDGQNLSAIFPSDLANTPSEDYHISFYQDQINSYLK